MSKNRNKNRSEIEHLRGIIRQLKAELKYHKRRSHIKDEPELEERQPDCENCGKGFMEDLDLKFVLMKVCKICGHKKNQKISK